MWVSVCPHGFLFVSGLPLSCLEFLPDCEFCWPRRLQAHHQRQGSHPPFLFYFFKLKIVLMRKVVTPDLFCRSAGKLKVLLFVKPHLRIFCPFIFRESEKEENGGEREKEKNWQERHIDWLTLACILTRARDGTCNPGTCRWLRIKPATL